MWIYIFIFLIVCLLNFLYRSSGGIPKPVFAAIMLFLALFVGLGDMLGGYDRYIYGELFDVTANTVDRGGNFTDTYLYNFYITEPGYTFFNYLTAFITANRYIFILIFTLLMYYVFYRDFIEETDNYGFALILFFGLYFFFTFTYLRQAFAVSLVGFSYRYIVRRKFLLFCLLMVLAVSFHNSAVIFFPMYFLARRIPSKKVIIWLSVGCLILGLSGIPSNIFEVYGDVTDSGQRAAGYMDISSGFRIEYLIEAVVFLVFLFIYHDKANKDRRYVLHYNIAICFCSILLLFCQSLNGGRLAWPFILGLICAVTPSGRKLRLVSLSSLALICMSFLLYLRILVAWGSFLSPYKTFLTDGVREGDTIHAKYEYDNRYDYNKFYR